MSLKNRSFTWWHNRMMLALLVSMVLAAVLVKAGIADPGYIPPGGLKGPLCYKAGGLFSPEGLFLHVRCIGFPGASIAGYLLTRGFYLIHPTMPVAGFILLGLECIAVVPVAWVLSQVLCNRRGQPIKL
ncbi:MAG: hypothetical protein R3D43_02250 [Tepidamorphaceae bacterium]